MGVVVEAVEELLFSWIGSGAVVAVSVVVVSVVAFLLFLRFEKTRRLPRQYVHRRLADAEMPKHSGEVHKDLYNAKKIPNEVDVIVIGSGFGSLACAGYLARAGKRVLVLEQHDQAGGCTHTFLDKGFEFDTGVHYLGQAMKKTSIILDLITERRVEWDELGSLDWDVEGTYDEIVIGEKHYHLRKGKFVEDLSKHFPGEEENLKKWVELCRDAMSSASFFKMKILRPRWLGWIVNLLTGRKFFQYVNTTALEMAKKVTDNEELQAVLVAQFGDCGRSPSTGTFLLQGCVVANYLNGGVYPRGGSSEIAKQIIPTIERAGGRVLVGMAVKSILMGDNGRCEGVEMANGDAIMSSVVVSGAGLFNTYKRMMPQQYIPRDVLSKMEEIGPSCSMIYVFVGMDQDSEALQLPSSNVWKWPSSDYDRVLSDFNEDPLTADVPVFMSFPSSKDSTCPKRFPGRATAVLLSICDHSFWAGWEGTKKGKRGKSYEDLKNQVGDRIVEEMYKLYPQCRGHVTYKNVGTSLTFNHYINSLEGEVYGMDTPSSRFQKDDMLRPYTHIDNFFLTGQDVGIIGVNGAMMSGLLTAFSVLGYGNILDMMSGRNLVIDILNARKMERKNAAKKRNGANGRNAATTTTNNKKQK
eukprot:m.22400 g.22400  ORF g.22400 m.22400 type:complete len:639 (+) comp8836_c0_seq1:49-1965(+)